MGPLSFVMLIQVHQYELTRNWFKSHSISRISGVPMPRFAAPTATQLVLWRTLWYLAAEGCCARMAQSAGVPQPPFFYHSADCDYETQLRSIGIFWSKLLRVDYESLWIGCKGYWPRDYFGVTKKTTLRGFHLKFQQHHRPQVGPLFFLWSVVVIIVIYPLVN